jgi:hypothetical protein
MTTEQATQTATDAATGAQSDQSAATGNSFSIPQEYAGKGWTEKITSHDDLFKAYDNAQSLLGKRPAGIPDQHAPDSEWEKFYNVFRPESPDKYTLGDIDGLPEGMDTAPYKQQAMQMFHEAGLNQKQAEKLWKSYVGSELEAVGKMSEAQAAKQAELDKEFDGLTQKLFGDQYDTVSKQAQDFIKQSLPPELSSVVGDMAENPKALAALIKLSQVAQSQIADVKKKYGAEDNLASGSQFAGLSKEDVVKKLVDANSRAQSSDPFSAARKDAMAEADTLRKQLALMVK